MRKHNIKKIQIKNYKRLLNVNYTDKLHYFLHSFIDFHY